MNQILFTKKKHKNNKIFKIVFYLSLFFMFFFIILYFSFDYNQIKKEKLSNILLNNFNIKNLYNNYTTVELNENQNFLIIGSISIPSINIEYPIISETTDEFLKIAPCRFYGPYPNKIGNMCLAGHNYDDNRFFSNLHKLNIGDEIKIYDNTGNVFSYYVYNKYEIKENDTSCTSQNTMGNKEITLVTCNNLNKNRLIIKAK